jgi:geranylgeranyl diphosphate synthase type I
MKTSRTSKLFVDELQCYKQLIDDDIAVYVKNFEKSTLQEFGANARLATDAYTDILRRGGKRIRGTLTMVGYEMCGGEDQPMIIQAARAIEMLHAYLLIIDDIQDRSMARRGGPSAHVLLADYHRKHHLSGDSEHFGVSLALNAALTGAHAAQAVLGSLNVDPAVRLKVLHIVNQTMITTAHGQTNDIMHEVVAEVTEDEASCVMEWKTAHYTFLNPLQVGMTLAGANPKALEAITPYALHAGHAFQIIDDIKGTFGTEQQNGKSPLDDIREGKRTLLTIHALNHATPADQNFLLQSLGNPNLTLAQFNRCQTILSKSGALSHAQIQARHHIEQATGSLQPQANRYTPDGIAFLTNLATYLLP